MIAFLIIVKPEIFINYFLSPKNDFFFNSVNFYNIRGILIAVNDKIISTVMTNFIPIFPLGIVVFPGEDLNLHIFEPRYKQLITDCFAEAKPFGIPTVLKNGLSERGTLVEVKEILEVYENGKLDIKTKGISVFRILEVVKSIPEKLYSGAIVNYPANEEDQYVPLLRKVVKSIRDLHEVLKLNKPFNKPDDELRSYDIAHHVGLSLEEEYELLGL